MCTYLSFYRFCQVLFTYTVLFLPFVYFNLYADSDTTVCCTNRLDRLLHGHGHGLGLDINVNTSMEMEMDLDRDMDMDINRDTNKDIDTKMDMDTDRDMDTEMDMDTDKDMDRLSLCREQQEEFSDSWPITCYEKGCVIIFD
jgi:hypothetical protein